MNNIKPYKKYKASGIAWLSNIPADWAVKKLKYLAECFPSNVDKHTREGEKKVRLCNYTDVYKNDLITNKMQLMVASASDEQIKRFTLLKDDVIITKDSETANDIAVPALVAEDLDNVICGYHLSVIRHKNNMLGNYLLRLFQHKKFNAQFEVCSNGVTRVALGVYDLQNAVGICPSLKEQTAIANFLDYKTAKIDRFIKKKKQLIKLLNEQKAGIIKDAVTKGLDENVKMQPSGIKWLGNIPAHWEVRKLKYLAKVKTGRTPKIENSNIDYFENGEINWYTAGDFKEDGILNLSKRMVIKDAFNTNQIELFPSNTIYLVSIGATIGKVGISQVEGSCNQQINAIMFNDLISPKFGYYLIKISKNQIDNLADFTTLPLLNQSKTKEIILSYPSLSEQKQIVSRIETETNKLNQAISTIEKEITLVQEYKTALIAEAVTGKIDVRDYKIPEIAEPENYEEIQQELSMVAEDEESYGINEEE